MDKEKTLKSFITRFVLGNIAAASVLFVWMYLWATGVISNKMMFASGIVLVAVSLGSGYFYNKKYGRRDKAQQLRVMPLIISIHDTPEKLKKTKSILTVLDVLSFGFGAGLCRFYPVFTVLCPLSFVFRRFAGLTGEKIKYIENKPEGL